MKHDRHRPSKGAVYFRKIATLGVILTLCGGIFHAVPRQEQKQPLQEDHMIWYNEEVEGRQEAFTDQVTPLATTRAHATGVEMTLRYDKSKPHHELFYKAPRTATLTIVDSDFQKGRVVIQGTATSTATDVDATAKKSDREIPFPTLSGWTSKGDRHTAKLSFTADAHYAYEVFYIDEQGKKLAVYPKETFVIDQTSPAIEIAGVTHKTSYPEAGTVEIKVLDPHLDGEQLSLTLSGAEQGAVELPPIEADPPNGTSVKTELLHKLDLATITGKEDDVYTLTVTAVDHAGNQTKKEITFSINQQGSRYAVEDLTFPKEGEPAMHLQAPQKLTITETNPDALEEENTHLTLRHNGVWRILTPEEDYQVTTSGGGGWNAKKQWHTYTYHLPAEVFSADGTYELSLTSQDAVGHENHYGVGAVAEDEREALLIPQGMRFVVDRTAPLVTALDLASGGEVTTGRREATFRILDNVAIDRVTIWLNGSQVTPVIEGNYYRVSLQALPWEQSLTVRAVDTTGNETDVVIEDFFAQGRFLFHRPDLIKRAVTLLVVVCWMGIILFILWKKRRRRAAQPTQTDEHHHET